MTKCIINHYPDVIKIFKYEFYHGKLRYKILKAILSNKNKIKINYNLTIKINNSKINFFYRNESYFNIVFSDSFDCVFKSLAE